MKLLSSKFVLHASSLVWRLSRFFATILRLSASQIFSAEVRLSWRLMFKKFVCGALLNITKAQTAIVSTFVQNQLSFIGRWKLDATKIVLTHRFGTAMAAGLFWFDFQTTECSVTSSITTVKTIQNFKLRRVLGRASSYSNFYSTKYFCDKIYRRICSIILAGISTRWNVDLIWVISSSRKSSNSKLDHFVASITAQLAMLRVNRLTDKGQK